MNSDNEVNKHGPEDRGKTRKNAYNKHVNYNISNATICNQQHVTFFERSNRCRFTHYTECLQKLILNSFSIRFFSFVFMFSCEALRCHTTNAWWPGLTSITSNHFRLKDFSWIVQKKKCCTKDYRDERAVNWSPPFPSLVTSLQVFTLLHHRQRY